MVQDAVTELPVPGHVAPALLWASVSVLFSSYWPVPGEVTVYELKLPPTQANPATMLSLDRVLTDALGAVELPKAVAAVPSEAAPVNDSDPPPSHTGVPPLAVTATVLLPVAGFSNPKTCRTP